METYKKIPPDYLEAGKAYIERVQLGGMHNPKTGLISSSIPSEKYDGSPMRIITEVSECHDDNEWRSLLDTPCLDNPLINRSDCNPDFIRHHAADLSTNNIPYVESMRTRVVERVSAVFEHDATPRMLASDFQDNIDFIFKDPSQPDVYRVASNLFFHSMSNKNILSFDIHDLVHHPIQLELWPEEFTSISGFAYASHSATSLDVPTADRLKRLSQLVWLATFEESLINTGDNLISFGCLNWLAPSETPADAIGSYSDIDMDTRSIAYKWHAIDALKDMYRVQLKHSRELGHELDWIEQLGYVLPDWFKSMCQSPEPRPLVHFNFEDAVNISIPAPQSPEELFQRALHLIEREIKHV